MKITRFVFKVLIGTVIFAGFLTVSSKLSRAQSEEPEIRSAWNLEKNVLLAVAVPVPPGTLRLEVPELVAKETQEQDIVQDIVKEEGKKKTETPIVDTVTKPTQAENISTAEGPPSFARGSGAAGFLQPPQGVPARGFMLSPYGTFLGPDGVALAHKAPVPQAGGGEAKRSRPLTQELTPQIPKVMKPAKAREEKARRRAVKPMTGQATFPKLSPPALLSHRELQAMVNYLDYEILPGRGVRFHYSNLLDGHIGHMWFLKRPRDLRGKTVRIDYQGYVPREMSFRIAKSGTSAAVVKKIKLADAPYKPRSIFIDIPNTVPFREVKHLEFWIDRETAGRSHGDFMIEKVVVLEGKEQGKQATNESRPESFPFNGSFVPTNLMRAEVPVS